MMVNVGDHMQLFWANKIIMGALHIVHVSDQKLKSWYATKNGPDDPQGTVQ